MGWKGRSSLPALNRECGPLIRWRDKDIIHVTISPCACGRPGPRLEFRGRVDDMLLVRGVNVFPNAVRDVVNRVSELTTGNIRIVKDGPGPVVTPPVQVKVEIIKGCSDNDKAKLVEAVENAIHHTLRFRAMPELIEEEEFEILTGTTGKARLTEEKKDGE